MRWKDLIRSKNLINRFRGRLSHAMRIGIDGLILGVAALFFGVSVFFIFEDGYLTQAGPTGEVTPVGKMASSRNDVRRRVEAGLRWSPVITSDVVYEGDSIFTGDESEAKIVLDHGGTLTIDPKSLVVVRTQGERLEIDLQYGSLLGEVSSSQPIVITQDGVKHELTAAETAGDADTAAGSTGKSASTRSARPKVAVRIMRREKAKETSLQVLSGRIRVRDESKTETQAQIVSQNDVVSLEENQAPVVKRMPVTLLAPPTGKTLWLPIGEPVRLQWKTDPASENGAGFQLEISRDTSFEKLVHTGETHGTSYDLAEADRPDGAFYWRVRPVKEDPRILPSIPSLLSVFPDLPPMLAFPADGQAFPLDEEAGETGKELTLAWEDKSGSTEFALQIARDSDKTGSGSGTVNGTNSDEFTDLVLDRKIQSSNLKTALLPAGTYAWRVKGLHPEREGAPWSRVFHFEVKPGPKAPATPILQAKALLYEIPPSMLKRLPAAIAASSRGVKPKKITPFAWAPVPNAESYEVELSSTELFENASTTLTTETIFAPEEVRPGPYFVRVRARGEDGRMSPPSESARLDVMIPPPQLAEIPKATGTYPSAEELEKGRHEFTINWTPQPFADGYELEWGADPRFTRSKTFHVKESVRRISVTKPFDYVARVRSLAADGTPISPFSKARVAAFRKELAPPPTVLPTPEPTPTPVPTPTPTPTPIPTPQPSPPQAKSRAPSGGLVRSLPVPRLREPRPETALISLESTPLFVTFRWKETKGATAYTLQLAQDADFANVIGEVKIKSNSAVVEDMLPKGRVFWRVRAHKGQTFSEWSEVAGINVIYE